MRNPVIFGKYLLLERINVGGMAEVFIGKAFGIEGFEKVLAVKKILPTMAADQEFITMFIDEARISVQLNHANVVHIHELGKHDDSFYIAMEYVSGPDLRTTLDRFRAGNARMPIAQAAYIAGKICEGLDYAHRKKDGRGEDLGIIHRDVSPQNVLISYEGEVKIIDFGIAKAANRSHHTQAGILKGKFAYMSPEQVQGQPIDRRSDIFAVGNILFEMLTGDRLFVGGSDYSVVEKVRNAEVPSVREIDPEIPEGLERILYKALAREVSDRYQWASEMQEDLLRFQLVGETIYSSKNLSVFMKEAFEEDYTREQERQQRFSTVPRPVELSRSSATPNPFTGGPRVSPGLTAPPSRSLQASPSTLLRPGRKPSLPAQHARPESPQAALTPSDPAAAAGVFATDTAVSPAPERRHIERGEKVVIGPNQAHLGNELTTPKQTFGKDAAAPLGPDHVFVSQISSASDLVRSDVNIPTSPEFNGTATSGAAAATVGAGSTSGLMETAANELGPEPPSVGGLATVGEAPAPITGPVAPTDLAAAVAGAEAMPTAAEIPVAPLGDGALVPPTTTDAPKPQDADELALTPADGIDANRDLADLAFSASANLPSLPEIPSITRISASPPRAPGPSPSALLDAAADEDASDSIIGKAVDAMFGEAPAPVAAAVVSPPPAAAAAEEEEDDEEEDDREIGPDEKTQAREVPDWDKLMDKPPAKKAPVRLSTDPGAARSLASARYNPTPTKGWDETAGSRARKNGPEDDPPEWPSLEGRGETVIGPLPDAPTTRKRGKLGEGLRARSGGRMNSDVQLVESMITSLPSIGGETRLPSRSVVTVLKAGQQMLAAQPNAVIYGVIGAATLLLAGLLVAIFTGPSSAKVMVKISPREALVRIDGQVASNYTVVSMEYGEHELVAGLTGFRTRKERFTVRTKNPVLGFQLEPMPAAPTPALAPAPTPAPNTAVSPPAPAPNAAPSPSPTPRAPVAAAPKTFTAVFDVSEPGVEIRLAGKTIGRSPDAKVEQLEVGKEYSYSAHKSGFKTLRGKFRGDQDRVTVAVSMRKVGESSAAAAPAPTPAPTPPPGPSARGAKGSLACATQPQGAQIFVDGVATNRVTPAPPTLPITLSAGRHKVTFKLNGKSVDRTVDIVAGEVNIIRAEFKE